MLKGAGEILPSDLESRMARCQVEQEIFELQLIAVEPASATLVLPTGELLIVRPPRWAAGEQSPPEFRWKFLIKDLGILARLSMGLTGYTQPWVTTRLVHEGEYLPMHLPVVALCPKADWYMTANLYCTFCGWGLRNHCGRLGAFKACWFCKDQPANHHGACCPHNPASKEWNGMPHWKRHRKNMISFLRTLPF